MKSLTKKHEDKKAGPRKDAPVQKERTRVPHQQEAQCCAKISSTVAGCHD